MTPIALNQVPRYVGPMATNPTPHLSPVLELRRLSRTYGAGETEVRALADVDFAVARGEMVAVMGPSGSGKSTLLTIAGTLERPSSGEVWIDGAEVSTLSRSDTARLRRRTIGYVFQDFNLLAGLTALENVSLPLELDGVGAGSAQKEAAASLAAIGLDGRGAHFPDQLSG